MATQGDPGLQRRKLKLELRRARTHAGLTQREAAERLDWSLSKLIRIESAAVGTSVTDLRAMLDLYTVTDPNLIAELSGAARASKGQAWWSQYRDVVPPQFAQFLAHESAAASIHAFHPFLVPGLLHTEDYAASLLRVHTGSQQVRRIVELRVARLANLLSREQPPDIEFVFGEEALYRLVGGSSVVREQLRHILKMSRQPGISVRIIPFEAGAYAGLLGPFVLLEMPTGSGGLIPSQAAGDQVLFVESASGDLLSRDDSEKISEFTGHLGAAREIALSSGQASKLLVQLIEQLHEGTGFSRPGGTGEKPCSTAGLGQPELVSRLPDLGEARWGCSRAGPTAPRSRSVPIISSACSTRSPKTGAVSSDSRSSSWPSSVSAALASRL